MTTYYLGGGDGMFVTVCTTLILIGILIISVIHKNDFHNMSTEYLNISYISIFPNLKFSNKVVFQTSEGLNTFLRSSS